MHADKYAHIDAEFRDQHGSNHPVDAGYLHQQGHLGLVRRQLLGDALVEYLDQLFDVFHPAQLHRQQEPLRVVQPSFERMGQFVALAAQAATRQIGHLYGRRGVVDQRPHDRPAGYAEHAVATLPSGPAPGHLTRGLAISSCFCSRLRSADCASVSLRR